MKSFSKRIAPAVLALGIAGGLVGASASAYAATASTAKGVVKTVNTKKDRLTVTVDKKAVTYKDTTKTVITLGGKTSVFADLKAGDDVTVTFTTAGKAYTATEVAATAK